MIMAQGRSGYDGRTISSIPFGRFPETSNSKAIRCRDPVEFSDRLPLIELRVARKYVAVILSIAKPERAVEVVLPLPSLQ